MAEEVVRGLPVSGTRMVKTGGPPSYVELLSCVEILRDARNIRNGDALESDDQLVNPRPPGKVAENERQSRQKSLNRFGAKAV
jgi:hypothetical protein